MLRVVVLEEHGGERTVGGGEAVAGKVGAGYGDGVSAVKGRGGRRVLRDLLRRRRRGAGTAGRGPLGWTLFRRSGASLCCVEGAVDAVATTRDLSSAAMELLPPDLRFKLEYRDAVESVFTEMDSGDRKNKTFSLGFHSVFSSHERRSSIFSPRLPLAHLTIPFWPSPHARLHPNHPSNDSQPTQNLV